jgi:uncharacterized protein YodC (DUF2158 family)
MAKFAVGDVVRLKSGGPKMTVSEIKPDGVGCMYWCEHHGEYHAWLMREPAVLDLAFEEDFGFYDETPLSEEELDCLVEQSNYYQDHGR